MSPRDKHCKASKARPVVHQAMLCPPPPGPVSWTAPGSRVPCDGLPPLHRCSPLSPPIRCRGSAAEASADEAYRLRLSPYRVRIVDGVAANHKSVGPAAIRAWTAACCVAAFSQRERWQRAFAMCLSKNARPVRFKLGPRTQWWHCCSAVLACWPHPYRYRDSARNEVLQPKLRARRVGRELASCESDLPVR